MKKICFLVVIDCFSKFMFVEPLLRKTTAAVIEGFKKILDRVPYTPERIQTDKVLPVKKKFLVIFLMFFFCISEG